MANLTVSRHFVQAALTGQPVELSAASFSYPRPAHGDEYRHIFHCPLTFDATDTALTFDRRFLTAPVIREKPEMHQFLKTSPADLLSRPDESNTFTGRIRTLIGRDFAKPLPDFEWIAAAAETGEHLVPGDQGFVEAGPGHLFSRACGVTGQRDCSSGGVYRAVHLSSRLQEVDRGNPRRLSRRRPGAESLVGHRHQLGACIALIKRPKVCAASAVCFLSVPRRNRRDSFLGS